MDPAVGVVSREKEGTLGVTYDPAMPRFYGTG
jgi:hypothetical protein